MISYKLCKKLKEVGFPFEKTRVSTSVSGCGSTNEKKKWIKLLYNTSGKRHYCLEIPTLPKLIKECGKLTNSRLEFHRSNTKKCWYAIIKNDKDQSIVEIQESAKTLEEAVGKLYLKLHDQRTNT